MSANVAIRNKHVTSFNDIVDNIATKTINAMNGTAIAVNLNNARNFTLYKNCFSARSLNSKRYFLYSSSIFSSFLCLHSLNNYFMLHHLTTNPIYCFFVHIIGFIVVYFIKRPIAA